MGTAFLSGLLNNIDDTRHELKFSLSAPSRTSLDRLRRRFSSPGSTDQDGDSARDGDGSRRGSKVDVITADNVTAAHDADVVILAFQPHQLKQVLADAALVAALCSKLIISLLAGVSCQHILENLSPSLHVSDDDDGGRGEAESESESVIPTTIRVARAMPTIGAQINESATLIAGTTDTGPDLELATWLFGLVGSTHVVPERLLDALTGINAATHALAVVALDAIVDASVAAGGGVSRGLALAVATQCLRGASTLLRADSDSGSGGDSMTVEGLKEAMSVPGGITINAVLELERGRVRAGISDAVTFAVRYAQGMMGTSMLDARHNDPAARCAS
ncbi:pyrroline-5-carboxylate reductase [Phialophora macrospora]|uniref:Pyrroline-5-carboxylate reductase n=1 Tax=Phialophora macrospora TaxID=1851006 RepID=A0A0D2FAS7_9EURO|nr:pyrroline-5-carboxylate reductase [Phialophora macrospora]